MKIGIVINTVDSEKAGSTTFRVAVECAQRGHEVWITSSGRFSYEADDRVGALARRIDPASPDSTDALVNALQSARDEWMIVDDLDVLFLRTNPAPQSAWAQPAGIQFGRLAMRHGVIVVNDPNGLAKASSKLYLQTFPEEVRPKTLITRTLAKLEAFAEELGTIVIKPLQGYGGQGVFVVRPADRPNLDEMFRAVSRDGYVVAQEYLPAAAEGDTRLFILNGVPLRHKGKLAAFRRIRTGDDVRSNLHAGGKIRRARVDETMLGLAEAVRPRLVEDGMFLVGLDIVGDKLMEINVFSPGGLGSAEHFEDVCFSAAVVDALQRKVRYMGLYRRNYSNADLATL